MFNRKKKLEKLGIRNEHDANKFMDKVTDKLSDKDLIRAHKKMLEKYRKKPNANNEYMLNYFNEKMKQRRLKI